MHHKQQQQNSCNTVVSRDIVCLRNISIKEMMMMIIIIIIMSLVSTPIPPSIILAPDRSPPVSTAQRSAS